MSIVLVCRRCGYAQRCAIDIRGALYSTVSGCQQRCRGCSQMLGIPDMFTGGRPGDLTLVNRDPTVIAIVANVVSEYARTGTFSVTEYDYTKLPEWARTLLDIANQHPRLASIALGVLGYLIGQMFNLGNMALDNYMNHKSALSIQDRQFQHDLDMIQIETLSQESIKDGRDPSAPAMWNELLVRVRSSYSELEYLRDGRSVTDAELQRLIANYNSDLDMLYSVLAEDRDRLASSLLGVVGSELVVDRPDMPLIEVKRQGRNSSCACGSGRKYKKCCGNPLVR